MFEQFIPKEMTRQEANYKIYKLIKDNVVVIPEFHNLILKCIAQYPQQRFGQIICNYVCPDYRCEDPTIETKTFMNAIFPENPDPFYEESVETYNRLKRE